MVANLCLITCALVTAQSADRSEWLVVPRLSQGQELVYRGSFVEEVLGSGAQSSRFYHLESRVLVIDTSSRTNQVAFYTFFRSRNPGADKSIEPEPSSVRIELARVSAQGAVMSDAPLAVPLEGPATVECGAFVEFPRGRILLNQPWAVSEDNRPAQSWRALGAEFINNTYCLKLAGVQQSADWDEPRGDRAAWRRRDTVWVALNTGVASKVERIIERREAAHLEPTQRSVVQYELQSNIQYPGRLFEDRKREILQACAFKESAAALLPHPSTYPQHAFDALLAKINYYLDNQPRTPYRDAVIQVKHSVEAARRGEAPVAAPQQTTPATLALGQRAPDFLSTNLLTRESARLRRWLGRPIVMVFYSPTSEKAEDLLRFAQSLQNTQHNAITVIGFAFSNDPDSVRRQHRDLQLTFPILSGKGLRQSYGVDATPKFVVIDADGVVRSNYVGWGPETPASLRDDVKTWVEKNARSGVNRPGANGILPRQ